MVYLHSRSPPMLHRDLKSDNVLMGDNGVAKVSDFGSIKSVYRELNEQKSFNMPISSYTATIGVGTPLWTAPEVYEGKHGRSRYGPTADVYSFGMLLYEIALREKPFFNVQFKNVRELTGFVSSGNRPEVSDSDGLSEEYRMLMVQCWDNDPNARPSFTDITQTLKAMSM
eukprot:m.351273 g.351273  ORF g.351273 m.351273 type:complete len:170 (-) comp51852_c0_seq1:26-535(-)